MTKRIKRIDTAQFNDPEFAGDGVTTSGTTVGYDPAEMADLYKELGVDKYAPVSALTHAVKLLNLEREDLRRQIKDANNLIRQQARVLSGNWDSSPTCCENTHLAQLGMDLGLGPTASLPDIAHTISEMRARNGITARELSDAEATIRYLTQALVNSQGREEELRKVVAEHREVVNEVRRGVRKASTPASDFGTSPGSICNRTHSGATPLAVTCVGVITEFHGPSGWRTPTCTTCGWTGEGRRTYHLPVAIGREAGKACNRNGCKGVMNTHSTFRGVVFCTKCGAQVKDGSDGIL